MENKREAMMAKRLVSAPQASALAGLRYAPNRFIYWILLTFFNPAICVCHTDFLH